MSVYHTASKHYRNAVLLIFMALGIVGEIVSVLGLLLSLMDLFSLTHFGYPKYAPLVALAFVVLFFFIFKAARKFRTA